MSELSSINSEQELCSEELETIEPKLKYTRLTNDLKSIFFTTSASCLAVHTKFICLGTHIGNVYVLDHRGHEFVFAQPLKPHPVAVNHISIDANGEYIASCSDDGKVHITGLHTDDIENNHYLDTGKYVKCVALDPFYYKSGSGQRFIIGNDKLTLYEKSSFLSRLRSTVLCVSEGYVRSIAWEGQFVAWSSDIGVRIYDLNAKCSLGLIKWERSEDDAPLDKFHCNLMWSDCKTLLIGWVETVRICTIRKRSNVDHARKDHPEHVVDIVSTFRTDYNICGLAPLGADLVLLGLSRVRDELGQALRPHFYIIEYRDDLRQDVCADGLALNGFQQCSSAEYRLCALAEESCFFIMAPRDLVVARPYDIDDRISWLLKHAKYQDALDVLTSSGGRSKKHKIAAVGIQFLNHHLNERRYEEAAKLCANIFGQNKQLWEENVYKFAKDGQLRTISQYLPSTYEHRLDPHIYEMVLFEYLKTDVKGFLHLVRSWNPNLYSTKSVVHAVMGHLALQDETEAVLFEALALLYSYVGDYDKSLAMYIKLQHSDVFDLIEKHKLKYEAIQEMIVDLVKLDVGRAVALFTDEIHVAPDIVIDKLENNEPVLFKYLDELNRRNAKGKYHGRLVKLYAKFNRDKLLPFLKHSDQYPIQEALDICQKSKFIKETIYLLGRIGDTKEALELIIKELKDIEQAVAFCQEHNDRELWEDLINHSQDKPEFITFLLQSIGNYVDPQILVRKIKDDQAIPGLKNSLVKMLHDYNLQLSVEDGFKKISDCDYFNLHEHLVEAQKRGIAICEESACGACHDGIFASKAAARNVLLYNCRHVFHEDCLVNQESLDTCGVCHPLKK